MANLGLMYEKGLGIEQDYGQAVAWFHKAIAAGESQAKPLLEHLLKEHTELR